MKRFVGFILLFSFSTFAEPVISEQTSGETTMSIDEIKSAQLEVPKWRFTIGQSKYNTANTDSRHEGLQFEVERKFSNYFGIGGHFSSIKKIANESEQFSGSGYLYDNEDLGVYLFFAPIQYRVGVFSISGEGMLGSAFKTDVFIGANLTLGLNDKIGIRFETRHTSTLLANSISAVGFF